MDGGGGLALGFVWFLKGRGWAFGLLAFGGARHTRGWDLDRGFGVLLGLVFLRLLASYPTTPLKEEKRSLTSRNKRRTIPLFFDCLQLKIFTSARCV